MKKLFQKKGKAVELTVEQVREMRQRIERVFNSLFEIDLDTRDFIKIVTQIQGVELILDDLEREIA